MAIVPPFHLGMLFENVDQALGDITWVEDNNFYTRVNSNNSVFLPEGYRTIGALRVGSASIERALLVLPSIVSRPMEFFIGPLGTEEPESPLAICDRFQNPIPVKGTERISIEVENDAAGSAEDVYGHVWFTKGPLSPLAGDWRTIEFTTAASAMTANVWNSRALTPASTLPPGRYTCGGARVVSATDPIGARFAAPGVNGGIKPGVPAYDAVGDLDYPMFRYGRLGAWFDFTAEQLPAVEVLPSTAINEVQRVLLDVLYQSG